MRKEQAIPVLLSQAQSHISVTSYQNTSQYFAYEHAFTDPPFMQRRLHRLQRRAAF